MSAKEMTHDDLLAVMGRALHDETFRTQLLSDTKGTLAAAGYKDDENMVGFFKSLAAKDEAKAVRHVTGPHKKDPIEFAGDM